MTRHRPSLALAGAFLALYPALPVAVARHAVTDTPQCERASHVAPARLAVFIIDSLDPGDVRDAQHFQRLRARFEGKPQGVVRECVDAVTVPCVRAMTTGRDAFSLVSLLENFEAERGLPEGSVIASLLARGVRVGFAGDADLAPIFDGVTHSFTAPAEDDARVVEQGVGWFERREADLVVMHLHLADHVAHRHGVRGPAYRAAVDQSDRLVAEALDRLPPDVQVLVTGDHGHDARGRHAAGLAVPTYAWSDSDAFLDLGRSDYGVGDHATGIGRVFGVERFACAPDGVAPAGAPTPMEARLSIARTER